MGVTEDFRMHDPCDMNRQTHYEKRCQQTRSLCCMRVAEAEEVIL